jgi:signal recognition particle subunit SRP19
MVEEEFDDDTDLPLPSFIPNTGARGPLLQEIDNEDDGSDSEADERQAGPASPPRQSRFAPEQVDPSNFDITPYKTFVSLLLTTRAISPYATH